MLYPMRTLYARLTSLCALLLAGLLLPVTAARAVSYTWNGTSTDWNNGANWLPTGVPAAADLVTINACTANCPVLAANTSLSGITMNGGTLNLGGHTLSVTGNAVFTRGTVLNGALSLSGNTTTFGNSSGGPSIEASVTAACPNVTFANTTTGPGAVLNITWLAGGAFSQNNTGGNVFNGPAAFTNAGTSYCAMGSTVRDIYNGDLTLTISGTGNCSLMMANASTGNQVNGNLHLNATGGWAILFGHGGGTATLKEGRQIREGTSPGFRAGIFLLSNFTQAGPTTQNITFQGGIVQLRSGTIFNGDVSISAHSVLLDGCTFRGAARVQRWGGGWNRSQGGNVFHGPATIINNSNSPVQMGISSPDTFMQDVTFVNTGSGDGSIIVANSSAGNQFGGNIHIHSTGASNGGVSFGEGGGTSLLKEGMQIKEVPGGFTHGTLKLHNFAQAGTTPQSVTGTINARIALGTGTTFRAPVRFTAPNLWLDGATYHNTATFIKTQGFVSNCRGGNTFRGKVTILNQGTATSVVNMATQVNDELLPPAPPLN